MKNIKDSPNLVELPKNKIYQQYYIKTNDGFVYHLIEKLDEKILFINNHKIVCERFLYKCLELNKELKKIYCFIEFENGKFLNLGECNNGDKFQHINQAINEAKYIVAMQKPTNNQV